MASRIRIDWQSGATANTVKGRLRLNASGFAPQIIQRVSDLIAGANGVHSSQMYVVTTAVQASGTVTLSSFAAADTITVNGRVYTGSASPSGAQQFLIGADDTATAVNFVAKLNADSSTVITGVVTGTSAAAVAALTSRVAGNVGNAITLAISAHGTVSGARMTGGSEDAPVNLYNGQAS